MRPFFKYFGSKWWTAKQYPAPVGVVAEPFAGAAGYCTALDVRRAVLVDTDERVCALWEFLIRATPREIMALPLMEPGDRVSDLVGVSEEGRLLLRCWMNNTAWRNQMLHPKRWFWREEIRHRVAVQVEQIRDWKVIHGSYEVTPETDTTFVDPPYEVEGLQRGGYRDGSGLSLHDVGLWCDARKGLVVACEQNCSASWRPWNGTVRGRRVPRQTKESVEDGGVYWVNCQAGEFRANWWE